MHTMRILSRQGAMALALVAALAPAASLAQTSPTADDWLDKADVQLSFATSLTDFVPALRGSVQVQVAARGTPAGVEQVIRMRSTSARLGLLRLGTVELDLRLGADAAEPAEVRLSVKGPAGSLVVDAKTRLTVDLAGRSISWAGGELTARVVAKAVDLGVITRAFPWLSADGRLELQARIGGRSDAPRVNATLQLSDGRWRGQPVGQARLTWAHRSKQTTLGMTWGPGKAPHATGKAKIPLRLDLLTREAEWLDAKDTAWELRAPKLTAELLRPFWQAPMGVELDLALHAKGAGPLPSHTAEITLAGSYAAPKLSRVPVRATLRVGSRKQHLAASVGGRGAVLDLTSAVPLVAVRRRGAALEPSSLRGSLDLALPLATAAPFLPAWVGSPTGRAAGKLAISGTLGSPRVRGTVEAVDASATLVGLNRRLAKVSLALRFEGDGLQLETFSADAQPGALSGEGALRWEPTPADHDRAAGLWGSWRLTGELKASLTKFPVIQPGFPLGKADATIRVTLKARPDDAHLALTVSDARIALTDEALPKTDAIPTNPAVRVVDWLGRAKVGGSVLAGRGRLVLETAIEGSVAITGDDVTLALGGSMTMTRSGPRIQVKGGFELAEGGRFALYENEFTVRAGRLTLAEGRLDRAVVGHGAVAEAAPLEAAVHLVARGTVAGTSVLVKLRGPMRRPELVLASVPPLPEYQILTLLISGRVDTVDDRAGNVRREVARLVSRYHNPSLKRQLFDKLGVDKLGFGFGSSIKNPIVTVGKQITRQLYVETVYHHDAPPDTNGREGHVEYRIGRNWTTDTVFGDAGEGRVGVFWSKRFGSRTPPPPGDDWGMDDQPNRRGDEDGDGIANAFDLCRRAKEDRDGFQDDDGCPDLDNDDDGIPDTRDKAPLKPENYNGFEDEDGAPDTAASPLVGLEGRVAAIRYARGSARLNRAGQSVLRAVARVIAAHPSVHVRLTGHSDQRGGARANLAISRARVRNAVNTLRRLGVPRSRIAGEALGSSRPADSAATPTARATNRRLEVRLHRAPAP